MEGVELLNPIEVNDKNEKDEPLTEHLYKIILIGDSGVGKSSLLLRYVYNEIEDKHYATVGIDLQTKTIVINDEKFKLQLWDTAGQEKFRSLISSYYRNAQGVILIFDMTNIDSFKNLDMWLMELDYYAEVNVQRLLVGNKFDMPNLAIDKHEVLKYAEQKNIPIIFTSALNNSNVELAMNKIVQDIRDQENEKNMIRRYATKNVSFAKNLKLRNDIDRKCCTVL